MMKLEMEVFDALCSMSTFRINGIDADDCNFGDKEDLGKENAEEYGCGAMTFTPKPSTKEVLRKYKINQSEYDEIANRLAEGLSFGCCGWCV